MTKTELVNKIAELRKGYQKASDEEKARIADEGLSLRLQLEKTRWCAQCKEKEAIFKDYYCSQECQDLYYPPRKGRPTIYEAQKKLLEMKKQKHLESKTEKSGQIKGLI